MFHSCAQTPNDSHVKTGTYGPVFTWLGIKNDYRTLIGIDEMDIVVKDGDEDEGVDDV